MALNPSSMSLEATKAVSVGVPKESIRAQISTEDDPLDDSLPGWRISNKVQPCLLEIALRRAISKPHLTLG